MRFWRFLKYEMPYFFLYAAGFLIVTGVYFTDPQMNWQWDTFIYTLVLSLFVVCGFFFHRYLKNVHAIEHMDDDDAVQVSLIAETYHQSMEKMRKDHIRELNEVKARQKEHYNFIVSWFHEIKTPIAVMRLMQQTEVDPRAWMKKFLASSTTRTKLYIMRDWTASIKIMRSLIAT